MTVPHGLAPTADDLPAGVTRVMDGLDPSLGCEARFLDLNLLRPSLEEFKRRLAEYAPHVLGFSGGLTHSYARLKELSLSAKEALPGAVQVLGGEMAGVANIVLQRTGVDFCVTGESEPTFSLLLARLRDAGFHLPGPGSLKDIPGLVFLLDGVPYFTGYAPEPERPVTQANYDILAAHSDLGHYMPSVAGEPSYFRGLHSQEKPFFLRKFRPENLSKRIAQVSTSKGCVGHCSFCHRFFKGYRVNDPDAVVAFIEDLIRKHDIGFVSFAEESFGANRAASARIVECLKRKGLNWFAGAVRAKTIDSDTVRSWKEAGCVLFGFGMESCSQKMLDVIDKRCTVEDNLEVFRIGNRHGLYPGVLLLIGMPGETEETIDESLRNLSTVLPDDIEMPFDICVNHFQPVPCTPGYEYARQAGLIGSTLDEEETYLLNLFGADASDVRRCVNLTDYEREELAHWRDYIYLELASAYLRKHGVLRTLRRKKAPRYRYAALYSLAPRPVRRFILKMVCAARYFGPWAPLRILAKRLLSPRPKRFSEVRRPLRELVKENPLPVRDDDRSTHVLRMGR